MEGWIKIHRKLQDWEWYKDSNMVHLFIHLLINANTEDYKWKGVLIKRGQIAVGREALSRQTGISERSIRTCINRLKSTSEVTIKSTSKFSVITICNYEYYQMKNNESDQHFDQHFDQQTTSQRPASDHNLRIKNIEYKEYRENIDNKDSTRNKREGRNKNAAEAALPKREKLFYESLVPFVEKYGKDMIREFFDYWSEKNKSGTKMRFELQNTWETNKRLATWARKQDVAAFKSRGGAKATPTNKEQRERNYDDEF